MRNITAQITELITLQVTTQEEIMAEGTMVGQIPIIAGPLRIDAGGDPPTFVIHSGDNRFYEVELAADLEVLAAGRGPANRYYSSLDHEPGQWATGATFTVPAARWERLRSRPRLYYRVWTSSDETDWSEVDVSVGDDNLDATPFVEIERDPGPRPTPPADTDTQPLDATPRRDPTAGDLRHVRRIADFFDADRSSFEARLPEYLEALGVRLAHHGLVGDPSEVTVDNLGALIEGFQAANNLFVDGVPGAHTLWVLNRSVAAARNLDLVKVTADVWAPAHLGPKSHGFGHFRLRADAVDDYERVRKVANDHGAKITSAGSFRQISAAVSAGRSQTSFHYSGLALDLATTSGMQRVADDAYLVTRDGTRRWRVWARAEGGESRTLEAVVHRPGRIEVQKTTARVIDLTELMAVNGFSAIGNRSCFPRKYICAEWWHFQYNRALTPQVSQFGAELLSLAMYSEDFLDNQTDIWNERKRVFRGSGRHRWG